MGFSPEQAGPFSVHPYLARRYAQVGRILAFDAQDEPAWRTWRERTVAKLRALTGHDTMERAPLAPLITEETDEGDYLRQRVEIQTEPGVRMPFYVLIPKAGQPPYPAIVAPHGHGSGGKLSVAGRRDIPAIAAAIAQYNYDYGVQFVRAGFITFCPDARGFGERQELWVQGDILAQSCLFINNMAVPLGQTIAGMWAWDLHRLIDYIETRPDCQADHLGCGGLSGGGLQTLWASALDERIRCAIISGYMYGYKQSLLDMCENCSCNYVPHLYEFVDMGDIAALIAPRPLLIETGAHDPLNGAGGLTNVYAQVDIARRAYALLGVPDRLSHDVFEGEHRWHGVQAIPWMQRYLMDSNPMAR